MSDLDIRRARLEDAAGINAVYNPYILNSPATFEVKEHSEAGRRVWLDEHSSDPRYPVFVADLNGDIRGFASASAFDPRTAYGTSVKTSVFLKSDAGGQGLGRRLYEALFEALKQEDVHRAYALIVAPNQASVALHEAFGFAHVSTLSEVGRKFGRYWDVMWFEKRF